MLTHRHCAFIVTIIVLVAVLPQKISSTTVTANTPAAVIELDDSNTEQIFQGHWVVLFYAPWCPACTNMKSRWRELADTNTIKGLKIAQIDVHEYPALSGQFLIFNLPTIYYIDEGSCKEYIGLHDVSAIKSWISDGTAQNTDPVPSWRSPNSFMLRGIGRFFHFANNIRTLKDSISVEYGIPSWMAYALFVCATILIGGMVGLTIVCICDCLFPPKPTVIIEEDRNRQALANRKKVTVEASKAKKSNHNDDDDSPPDDEDSVAEDDSEGESDSAVSPPAADTTDPAPDSDSDNKKQVRKRQLKK